MTRFNKTTQQPQAQPVIATKAQTPTLATGNNAPGYERTTQAELLLLGVSNFYGQDTFYETGAQRDERYIQLIQATVKQDHLWVTRFLRWLRHDANMRTASLVGAVEATREMIKRKIPGGRTIINHVLVRADEPGEMLAYWLNNYGRKIPQPIKRGLADAASRLYTEPNTIKYDTKDTPVRFGDVLELCHPAPKFLYQKHLFRYLINRRHRQTAVPDELTMLVSNAALQLQAQMTPQLLLNESRLRLAGMTWESAKSLAGSRIDDKLFWQAMIPNMGYMALLRNLRNFDQAGIDDVAATLVTKKLTDPDEVAKSRQLPMRFLSAYRNVVSDRWKFPLSQALQLSLGNIPALPGNTLILIDSSGSMTTRMSDKSGLNYQAAATIFGLALAQAARNGGQQATVVSFSDLTRVFPPVPGETLLQSVDRWAKGGFFFGGGTETERAVNQFQIGHDRLVILTDEQYSGHRNPLVGVSPNKPVITFNLAGYRAAQVASGPNRVTIGGLSDQAFTLLPVLEGVGRQQWPF